MYVSASDEEDSLLLVLLTPGELSSYIMSEDEQWKPKGWLRLGEQDSHRNRKVRTAQRERERHHHEHCISFDIVVGWMFPMLEASNGPSTIRMVMQ